MSCKSCKGGGKADCIYCATTYKESIIDGILYCKSCVEFNEHFIYSVESNDCIENCGDGYNDGYYECDDGNNDGGDGCSSDCKIERSWRCHGYESVCENIKPVLIKRLKVFKDLSFSILLSKQVKIIDFKNSFAIALLTNNKSELHYATEVLITPYSNYSKIVKGSFKINTSVEIEDIFEVIPYTNQTIVDKWNNQLSNTKSYKSTFKNMVADSNTKSAEAVQKSAFITTLITMAITLAFTLVFNTPIEGMWALVCMIQLASYLTMLNLELPSNLKSVLNYMEMVHSFGAAIPNPLVSFARDKMLNITNNRFYERGFTTNYSLYLCGSDIEMIVLQVLLAYAVSKLALKIKFFQRFVKSLKYNMALKTMIVAYVRIVLSICINICEVGDKSAVNISFLFVASVLLVGMVVYPFVWGIYFSSKIDDIILIKNFNESYSTLLPVKNTLLSINFYPVFLVKRLLFCAIIVVAYNRVTFQLIAMLGLSLMFIVYLVKVRPLSDVVSQRGFVIAEIGYMLIAGMIVLTGMLDEKAEIKQLLGWLTIGVIIAVILGCWVNLFMHVIPDVIQKLKKKCKERKK